MKVKTLTLASVAGSLVLVGTSSANFTGLAATSQSYTTVAPGSAGIALDVFELWATFDSAGDQAAAVGGTPLLPNILNSGGSGFYQATNFAHFNNAVVAAQVAGLPDFFADSMFTMGIRQGYTGAPVPLTTVQNMNLAAFNGAGAGFGPSAIVTSTNGGWLASPFTPVTAAVPYPPPLPTSATFSTPAGATHGVILGQFSVAAGNVFSGDLGSLAIFEGANSVTLTGAPVQFSFQRPLPAPGALALLGLAGLAGTRRRRS